MTDQPTKTDEPLLGNATLYSKICWTLLAAFLVCGVAILALNCIAIVSALARLVGPDKVFFIQIYFWGALGATVASSIFLGKDKEANVTESVKEKPDPNVLQYPDAIDVHLYLHRILTSGFLGVVGGLVILGGLGYFDVPPRVMAVKQRLFLIVFSFLIGLYQANFLTSLSDLSKRFFHQRKNGK